MDGVPEKTLQSWNPIPDTPFRAWRARWRIYIYICVSGERGGRQSNTLTVSPTEHRCPQLSIALAGPPWRPPSQGCARVWAEGAPSVVVSFKREAVCHQLRAVPVLGHSASKTTFFCNLDGSAAATLRKRGEGWSRGLRELDTNGSSFEGNHDG